IFWPAPTSATPWLAVSVVLASDAIGKVASSWIVSVDLNGKPARNSVCAVMAQPSVFFGASSRFTRIAALPCFGSANPVIARHFPFVPSGGSPVIQSGESVGTAEQLPPGADTV